MSELSSEGLSVCVCLGEEDNIRRRRMRRRVKKWYRKRWEDEDKKEVRKCMGTRSKRNKMCLYL